MPQDRGDAAEPLLKSALATDPLSAEAHHAMRLLYVRSNRLPAAVDALQQASTLVPDNARFALVYGVALLETGRVIEGLNVLRKAELRFPGDPQIREVLQSYQGK